MKKIAIIGSVGVPNVYGGFEALAENLAKHHHRANVRCDLYVYCSAFYYPETLDRFFRTKLNYVPIKANGIQSIAYDIVSIIWALVIGCDSLLVLGVSGALVFPLIRLFTRVKIVTNVDGLEWKRKKWNRFSSLFLKISERIAVKYSHVVVSDNQGIADYLELEYGVGSSVIPYGGDHAISTTPKECFPNLPRDFALAVCRIEPENNVDLILNAFSNSDVDLVFVGNWQASSFGRSLYDRFSRSPRINLLDPIYDLGVLRFLRERSFLYVHGHSAGGTNPSLVEMMHFGVPVLAYDCVFNRFTTEDKASYFLNSESLLDVLETFDKKKAELNGLEMASIAQRRYTWTVVGEKYFKTILQSG